MTHRKLDILSDQSIILRAPGLSGTMIDWMIRLTVGAAMTIDSAEKRKRIVLVKRIFT
jgi:hypothetical protein